MGKRMLGSTISGAAAALVLLGFFLPWVVISCNEVPWLSLSGDQLAVGGEFTDEFGTKTEEFPGQPVLLLVPVTAALVLLIAVAAYFLVRGGVVSRAVPAAYGVALGAVQTVLGALGALAMYQVLAEMAVDWNVTGEGATSGMDLAVRAQYGLWMAAAGLLGIVLGGIIGLVEAVLRRGPSGEDPDSTQTG